MGVVDYPAVRFGRLPEHPADTHPRLRLAPYLAAAPPPPPVVDWYSHVPSWPMYRNNLLGCCTIAMAGHEIGNTSMYAWGGEITLTDDDIVAAYRRVSGYDPADPATDRGAVLQDVYGDWRRNGIGGHRALAFARVNEQDVGEIRQAVATFGAAGLGIVVTQQMMDDFYAGHPWVRDGGSELGGHAVPIVGYDTSFVYVVTWGKLQPMSWGCLRVVTDEAWVAVLPEWVAANGTDPAGVDLYGLGQALAQLTGEPNPFPPPAPEPVPPDPAAAADQALAEAAAPWLTRRHGGQNRAMAQALQTWIAAKRLG